MAAEEKLYDLIERYLSNQLDEEELLNFEKRILADEELKKEIELHKNIQDAVFEKDVIEFRSAVQNAVSEKREKAETIFRPFYYKIAASISLLLAAGVLIYNAVFTAESPDALFNKFFMPYDNLISVRGDNSSSSDNHGEMGNEIAASDISRAMVHYDKKKYRKAINYFSKTDYKNNDLIALYMGVSFISTDALDSAQIVLTIPTKERNGMFYYPGRYYQGLIYLKKKNFEKARAIFTDLKKNAPAPYNQYAEEILESL